MTNKNDSNKLIILLNEFDNNIKVLEKNENINLEEFIIHSKIFIKILLNFSKLVYLLKIYNRLYYTLIDYDNGNGNGNVQYFLKIINYNNLVIDKLFVNSNTNTEILIDNFKLKELNDYLFAVQNFDKNNVNHIIEVCNNPIKLFIDITILKNQILDSIIFNEIEKNDNLKFFYYISYRFHSYLLKNNSDLSDYLEEIIEILKNIKDRDRIYFNSLYNLLIIYEKYMYDKNIELKNETIIINTLNIIESECLSCVINFKNLFEKEQNIQKYNLIDFFYYLLKKYIF